MQPLLFLTIRQVVNGFKRALRSPQRLLGLVLALGFWCFFPLRSIYGSRGVREVQNLSQVEELARQLPVERVIGVVALGFIALNILLLGGLTARTAASSTADVDVLFPTPVSLRLVLGLRMLRDSFGWYIMPILGLIFSGPILFAFQNGLKANQGQAVTLATQLAVLSFWLVSAVFTALGYGLSLRLSQSSERTERERRILNWTLAFIAIGVLTYLAMEGYRQADFWAAADAVRRPYIMGLFPVTYLATAFATAPITGNWTLGGGAFALLVASVVGSVRFALAQARFYPESSALRAAALGEVMEAQKTGNMTSVVAAQARQGKFKAGRSLSFSKWRAEGPTALLWRDAIFAIRLRRIWLGIVPLVIFSVQLGAFLWVGQETGRAASARALDMMYKSLAATALGFPTLFSVSFFQMTFVDFMKRIDVVKAFPFSPAKVVLYEVIGKALPIPVGMMLTALLGTLVAPHHADFFFGTALACAALVVVSSALGLLGMLLFPDIEDAAQRPIRGLVTTFGFFLLAGVLLAPFLVLMLLAKLPAMVSVLPTLGLSAFALWLLVFLSARMYSTFNPRE